MHATKHFAVCQRNVTSWNIVTIDKNNVRMDFNIGISNNLLTLRLWLCTVSGSLMNYFIATEMTICFFGGWKKSTVCEW